MQNKSLSKQTEQTSLDYRMTMDKGELPSLENKLMKKERELKNTEEKKGSTWSYLKKKKGYQVDVCSITWTSPVQFYGSVALEAIPDPSELQSQSPDHFF
ncbi:unnamed protein product [Eretmochelys imbricata]